MPRSYTRRSRKTGLAPGSPVHVGEKRTGAVAISLFQYNQDTVIEKKAASAEECLAAETPSVITWINVDGLHDVELIEKIGSLHQLHPLTTEDIVNTEQRPKMEDYGDYLYIVMKTFNHTKGTENLESSQVSLILKPDLVMSFQEMESDVFDPLRERIRKGKGRIRKMGSDYLAYGLMDCVIDRYFTVAEDLSDRIEGVQEELVGRPSRSTLQTIYDIKHELIVLRKFVWPLRDFLSSMWRGETGLIQDQTRIYLRDIYDHAVQIIETTETFRETLSGMIDIYLSSISNKMNEIMKVLTIIATTFIPLTFITGFYGMNFEKMPGKDSLEGFVATVLVMLAVVVGMLSYFRKRKWF
jgi:magnesium transporter